MNVGRGVVRSDHQQLPQMWSWSWGKPRGSTGVGRAAEWQQWDAHGSRKGLRGRFHPGSAGGDQNWLLCIGPRLCLGNKPPSLQRQSSGLSHCQSSPKAKGALFCPLVLLQSPPGDISGELEAVKFKRRELNPLAS